MPFVSAWRHFVCWLRRGNHRRFLTRSCGFSSETELCNSVFPYYRLQVATSAARVLFFFFFPLFSLCVSCWLTGGGNQEYREPRSYKIRREQSSPLTATDYLPCLGLAAIIACTSTNVVTLIKLSSVMNLRGTTAWHHFSPLSFFRWIKMQQMHPCSQRVGSYGCLFFAEPYCEFHQTPEVGFFSECRAKNFLSISGWKIRGVSTTPSSEFNMAASF